MEWINLHIPSQIRHPAYIGSSPAERGTWISVLAYACEIECGGRLVGAATWKDRQWQQSCGVTKREVMDSDRLLTIDGDDVIVNGYPEKKEAIVRENRKNGHLGGVMKTQAKTQAARTNGALGGRPRNPSENPTEGEGEGEGEGEVEGERAREPDQHDLITTTDNIGGITGQTKTDSDRWRYEIGQTEWARAVKRAGGKIGADNWPTWEAMIERIGGLDVALTAMGRLSATERWPDRVEEASGTGPASTQDEDQVAKAIRDEVERRVDGEVFVKSSGLLKAAKRYGLEQVLALADHAANQKILSKDLGNHWFNGRPSSYGGWDYYEPKKPLDKELTANEIAKQLQQIQGAA